MSCERREKNKLEFASKKKCAIKKLSSDPKTLSKGSQYTFRRQNKSEEHKVTEFDLNQIKLINIVVVVVELKKTEC